MEGGKDPSMPRYDYIDGGSEHGKSMPRFDLDSGEDSHSYYRDMNGKMSVLPASETAKGYADVNIDLVGDEDVKDEIKDAKKKEEKKAAKQLFDKVKINMANERTFAKWVLTGMQMGAIGTFVLYTLDRDHNITWGMATLAFAWVVGFSVALYGMVGFYGRRKAITTGNLNKDPATKCGFIPFVVIVGLVSVVISSLLIVGLAGLPAHSNHSSSSTNSTSNFSPALSVPGH